MSESVLDISEAGHGRISQYFKHKSVFITGGTGFIGKVLIEKLLRCCPGIENIYVLVREKRKMDPCSRIKQMTALPLFDVLKEKFPESLEKLKPVKGDVTEIGLGLCEKDREKLEEKVSIIYHAAASVRFDDSLAFATKMNVRGTLEVVKLALRMKKLEVFVHISTTYCNLHDGVVEEKIYPAPADWRDFVRVVEEMDDLTLRILTPKILAEYPNTYTFTKALAEHVIYDHSKTIPSVIFRPSILVSTAYEPFPGWIDNFNGPAGLLVGGGMGLMHSFYCKASNKGDYVPVDISVNATITATWKKGTESLGTDISVYNCSNNETQMITIKEIMELGFRINWNHPLGYCISYPYAKIIEHKWIHFVATMLLDVTPAAFIDLLLKTIGKKPKLLKLMRRVYNANMALEVFLFNEWRFLNNATLELLKELHGSDKKLFGYSIGNIDVEEFYFNAIRGSRKFLLKRNDDSCEKEIGHMRRMYVLHLITVSLSVVILLWLLYHWFQPFHY